MECAAPPRKRTLEGRGGYAAAAFRLRWRAVSRLGSSTVSSPIAGSQAQTEEPNSTLVRSARSPSDPAG